VALTAFAGPEDQRRAEEAGFDRYMAEPFDAERLVEMLRQLLPPGDAPSDRHSPLPSG
jgi:CheY-like chemotaxis protein